MKGITKIGFKNEQIEKESTVDNKQDTQSNYNNIDLSNSIDKIIDNCNAISNNNDINLRNKKKLIEENRKLITILKGGEVYSNKPECIIYAILIFSVIIIGLLSFLTVFLKLNQDILKLFISMITGGVIAAIVQQLSKTK